MYINKVIDQLAANFRKYPNKFWAKKFDEAIHIPENYTKPGEFGGGTFCGEHGALLGNNYAPTKPDAPICRVCAEKLVISTISATRGDELVAYHNLESDFRRVRAINQSFINGDGYPEVGIQFRNKDLGYAIFNPQMGHWEIGEGDYLGDPNDGFKD
jgi:hypothetical protein